MKESKRLKSMEQPTGRRQSVSGQTVEQSHATMSLTMSERSLHDYVRAVCERTDIRGGVPLPLGTYARGEGVNFAFFSRHASRVRLELFDHPNDATATRVIDLDPARDRSRTPGNQRWRSTSPVCAPLQKTLGRMRSAMKNWPQTPPSDAERCH